MDRVDNYGLLNLDIVWTYLHLNSLQYLADADARLKICEESFYRCYGSNLERLIEIKGTSGTNICSLIFVSEVDAFSILICYLSRRRNCVQKH